MRKREGWRWRARRAEELRAQADQADLEELLGRDDPLLDDEEDEGPRVRLPRVKLPGPWKERIFAKSREELEEEEMMKLEESAEWQEYQRRMDEQAMLNW